MDLKFGQWGNQRNCQSTVFGRPSAVILAVITSVALSGCGTYLHSKTRDDQAAAAVKALQAVDLNAVFNTERRRQAGLLKREQDNQIRLGAVDRDASLRLLAAEPLSETLVPWVRADIQQTVGPGGSDAYEDWANGKTQGAAVAKELSILDASVFQPLGTKVPMCGELEGGKESSAIVAWRKKSPPTEQVTQINTTLQKIRKRCSSFKLSDPPGGGELAAAWQQYQAETKKAAKLKTDSDAVTTQYNEKKEAYADATVNPKPIASDIAKKKQELIDAISKLTSSTNPLVAKFIAEEEIKSIHEFIQALNYDPSKPVTQGVGQIAALATLIPQAIDQTRAQLAEGKRASLTPLLIERNSLELKAAAATKDIVAQKNVVEVSRQIYEAYVEQARRLVGVNKYLKQYATSPYLNMSLTTAQDHALQLTKTSKGLKAIQTARRDYETLEGAALLYLEAGSFDTQRRNLEYQRWAAYQERTVGYSQDSLAQWKSAVDIMVNQLAAYHKAGFTADDFLKPLNSLTLVWIAASMP